MGKSADVDTWFANKGHPRETEMKRVRDIILAADPRIDECVKWSSPTYTFGGNLASFMPNAKKHVSLMFHTGAQIPGRYPALEGSGDTARFMKFADLTQIETLRPQLEAIVRAWCALKSGEPTPAMPRARRAGGKKTAKST